MKLIIVNVKDRVWFNHFIMHDQKSFMYINDSIIYCHVQVVCTIYV